MKSYIGIEDIFAHEILDSRGIPTIETEVYTDDGNIGRASVPAVTSPGQYEAHELKRFARLRSCGSKCIRRGAIPVYRRNRRKENAGTFG